MQGTLDAFSVFTVTELANHNRPTKAELKEDNVGHSFERLSTCPPCGDLDGCHLWKEYNEAPDA